VIIGRTCFILNLPKISEVTPKKKFITILKTKNVILTDGHYPRRVQHLHDDDALGQRAPDVEILSESEAQKVSGGIQHLQTGLHQSHLSSFRRNQGTHRMANSIYKLFSKDTFFGNAKML
jgi:hypothetical protein